MADHVVSLQNHPSVHEHYANRAALIFKEQELRSDHAFPLSPTALQAHQIVSKIREREHDQIWSTSNSTNGDLFPGMIFNTAKFHMRSTCLWKIVNKMPKGSLLHCHLGAMVDLNWVFEIAIETPLLVFSSNRALDNEERRDKCGMMFKILQPGKEVKESIWTEEYLPRTWVGLKTAASTFPNGGKEGFIKWAVERCVISQEESISSHLGVNDIWRKLVFGFSVISPIVFYEPILRKFLSKFWGTCLKDGLRWVEMRGMTRSLRLLGEEEVTRDSIHMVRIIHEELGKFMGSEEGKGFWGCRLIWDTQRSWEDELILNDMSNCLRAKTLYPNLISGYDLVGPEDHGKTLHHLTPLLLHFRQQCISHSLTIPFFFHAGETLGSGSPTDQNLYDALLLKTRRIGHGFSLYKHPLLLEMVKEKEVLVESCPISNEVLRYSGSILSHPLPALINRGVKCALSNDDPAFMGHGTGGVGADFWQVLQGLEDGGLAGLGSLAENSVRWSAFEDMSDEEWLADVKAGAEGTGLRAKRIKEWRVEWEEFCAWVVEELGEKILN